MARVAWGDPIYMAADLFRQRVLVEGNSFLWPEHQAWTDENISAVFDALLIQKPEGTASFLKTLEKQLADLPDDAIRIAADVYAFYWLFPRAAAVSSAKKIQSVQQIALWRGAATALPAESQALLDVALDEGIGLPGQYFLLYQWEYLRFFLAFFRAIRRGAADPFDSEACRQLVYRITEDEGIKSHGRHVLLYLMFPDDFEWTATTSQKELIIAGFPEAAGDQNDLDLALRRIRNDLVNLTGDQNMDFYDELVRKIWDPEHVQKPDPLPAGKPTPQRLAEMLIPDEAIRMRALTVLADIVELADGINPKSWSITLATSYIAVNVGQSSAASMNAGHLAFALSINDILTHSITELQTIASEFDPESLPFAKAYPHSRWVRVPYDRLLDVQSPVWEAQQAMTRTFASGVKTQTGLGSAHSREMVDYLNKALERTISQPGYIAPSPARAVQYWKVTAGAGGRLWSMFRDEGIIAAEWPAIGDLREVPHLDSKDDFRTFLSTTSLKDEAWGGEVGYATNQLWSFWGEMRPGDRVVACDAKQTLAVGTITGDYGHDPEARATSHRRAIEWEYEVQTPFSTLSPELQTRMAFNANIRELTAEQFTQVAGSAPPPPPPFERLVSETLMDRPELEDLLDLLHDKKQLILEGPPGSGKTWLADKLARYLTGNSFDGDPDERVELVQFHQSYGYEDFVQGIRPITDADGRLTYRVVPGIFTRFCRTAASNPGKAFVLIIDEINRGNLSRIFGELLLLLEYRERRVRLPYGTEGASDAEAFLAIPPNLYVIGTMNSTDRSLALIDYALRRRFYFHRLLPMADGLAPVLTRWLEQQGQIEPAVAAQIAGLFIALNSRIQQHLAPDFQIGHSYFMRPDIGTAVGLRRVWDRAIRPLLEEYFHGSRSGDQTLDGFRLEILLPPLASPPATPGDVGETA